ncbi:ADP-ribosylation factor-like protein 6 isoform X1 [Convolutriloba macropyga]|uniref:ADP-ribosylation factor-like protein 6 isoform X1 n=1 Tax=Convolutriloba macropyga TaxID=536237 RepID=UPI003F528EBE
MGGSGSTSKPKTSLLILGLDNSGKTTIINSLLPQGQKDIDIVPTIGFAVQRIRFPGSGITASCIDMSGSSKYRDLWSKYFSETDGIIFVVDGSDELRLAVAKDEFDMIISSPAIKTRKVPILVLSNKKDVRGHKTAAEVSKILELTSLKTNNWNICDSNALSGDGLNEGFSWISGQLKGKR